MPYRSGRFDRIFYVRWQSAPNASDLASLFAELEKAAKLLGTPVSYLTIVPPEAPVPNPDERQALEQFAQRLRPIVEHAYVVLEGEGFKASIQRSVVIGLTFWKERGFTTIFKTVDEALHKIAARVGADYATLARDARAHDLLR